MAIRVAGICGSLRGASINKGLLRAAAELAPAGMEIQIYTRLGDIPPYNDDVFAQGDPEPVADMKKFIGGADALLIVTPEYNYGVPGVLKNAIDWASRPSGKCVLNRKAAALMGCSPGLGGTIRCQHALRQTFVFTETHVMSQPEIKIPSAAPLFDGDCKLTDENTRQHVKKFLEAFAVWIGRFKD
ncbi:MAG: NAD(P)H-dependent oxidoreductase [Deltaproteobacteria bacterium]|nr:NAD(P)H-dependent oxidoreductase [Deltaproteobacteria bacterium]